MMAWKIQPEDAFSESVPKSHFGNRKAAWEFDAEGDAPPLEHGDTFALCRPLGELTHGSERQPVYQFLGAQTARF
jgi:hypothetical protein